MKYLDSEEIRSSGLLQEMNRTLLHPLGLAAEVDLGSSTLRIQDHRDDHSGVIYGEGTMEPEKYSNFQALQQQRHESRLNLLGFVIQDPAK